MSDSRAIVVAGATGFVGRALVSRLEAQGHIVHSLARSRGFDLMDPEVAMRACSSAEVVFNLAAQVGGIGFIEKNDADCMLSSLINTHLLRACDAHKVDRYFYASSSCVYPGSERRSVEREALPAHPNTGYGWEKIFSEQMCLAFAKDKGVPVTIARFHTLYGPGDNRPRGREHVIEALCKKVVAAKLSGIHEIGIWGDGNQTRSFLYIDDCVEGIWRLADRGVKGPVNLAGPEIASVNQLVTLLENIAEIKLERFYNKSAPVGVIYKTSDNAALRAELNWEPPTPLFEGLEKTYRDVFDRTVKNELWQTSSIQTR